MIKKFTFEETKLTIKTYVCGIEDMLRRCIAYNLNNAFITLD